MFESAYMTEVTRSASSSAMVREPTNIHSGDTDGSFSHNSNEIMAFLNKILGNNGISISMHLKGEHITDLYITKTDTMETGKLRLVRSIVLNMNNLRCQ